MVDTGRTAEVPPGVLTIAVVGSGVVDSADVGTLVLGRVVV